MPVKPETSKKRARKEQERSKKGARKEQKAARVVLRAHPFISRALAKKNGNPENQGQVSDLFSGLSGKVGE
ncbi:hypothetical protein HBDW_20980 [Herbaspirillum sp. DW155]|uniref:hypothetical protein n=1 Tax=Herbaspirillum sp. DW155 TaxID=3095609 RepID=UPI00308CF524|nr:hypothetical protein HBDW_20980 [Herbaspirillum sp. DW155]